MKAIQKIGLTTFAACVLGLATTGCNRAESPAKTQADVANAQLESAKNVEDARQDAAKDMMAAQKDVNQASTDLAHETAQGRHDVTVAMAESAHKVATEKCEGMTGDPRTACMKQADADLASAKVNAESTEKANDPK